MKAPLRLPRKWLKRRSVALFEWIHHLFRPKNPPIPFRLLDLHDLPLRRCLMHPDMLDVAFCSQRAYRIFKSIRVPITGIGVRHEPEGHEVGVVYKAEDGDLIGRVKHISVTDSMTLADCVEAVDEMAAKLADLFNTQVSFCRVDPASVPDYAEYLSPSRMKDVEYVMVPEYSELSYPHFVSLLAQMTGQKTLILICGIPVSITTQPPWHFPMQTIIIQDCGWITEHNFEISVNCEVIALYRAADCTLRAISKIIRDWQEGVYPKLSVIRLIQTQYAISPEEAIGDPSWTSEAPQIVPEIEIQAAPPDVRYLALERHDGTKAYIVYSKTALRFKVMNDL